MYFADRALIILTDYPHLVGTAVTNWLVVALTESYKLHLFSTKNAFDCHVEIFIN